MMEWSIVCQSISVPYLMRDSTIIKTHEKMWYSEFRLIIEGKKKKNRKPSFLLILFLYKTPTMF